MILSLLVFWAAYTAGCDGSSVSDDDTNTGTLSLHISDTASPDFNAVYVTIDEVRVQMTENGGASNGNQEEGGSWKVVATPRRIYNLLDLVNGKTAELGTADLEAGHYSQMRLIIGQDQDDDDDTNENGHPYDNYVITRDGVPRQLEVPEAYGAGINLIEGFEIAEGQQAELVVDFDANRSVVAADNGRFLLKPEVKIVDRLNYALVNGVVEDGSGNRLPGAIVSAQRIVPEGLARVFTSTLTGDEGGETGAYQMYLPPGDYYIVAYKGGEDGLPVAFGPECKVVEADSNEAYGEDLEAARSNTGEIEVDLKLPEISDKSTIYPAIRIFKNAPCRAMGDQIEVVSRTVRRAGTYTFSVPGSPTGTDYTVLASWQGEAIMETVSVESSSIRSVEFVFTNTDMTGEIGSRTIDDNVVIPRDTSAVFNGTIINGNVVVLENARLVANSANIRGNVQAYENAVVEVKQGTIIDGDLQGERTMSVTVGGLSTRIEGNIQVTEAASFGDVDALVLQDAGIGGDVQAEKSSGGFVVENIFIGGNLQFVENFTGPYNITENWIDGDLQFFKNRGPATITDNTVGGNLQSKENSPAPAILYNSVDGSLELD